MNWEALGALGETIGAIVVIVSVIYLAAQLRHANEIARFNTSDQLQARFNDLNKVLLSNESLRELLSRKDTLTEEEQERLYIFANLVINVWIAVQQARNSNQIDEELFRAMINDVHVALERWPQIRSSIELWLSRYPETRDFEVFDAVLRPERSRRDA